MDTVAIPVGTLDCWRQELAQFDGQVRSFRQCQVLFGRPAAPGTLSSTVQPDDDVLSPLMDMIAAMKYYLDYDERNGVVF